MKWLRMKGVRMCLSFSPNFEKLTFHYAHNYKTCSIRYSLDDNAGTRRPRENRKQPLEHQDLKLPQSDIIHDGYKTDAKMLADPLDYDSLITSDYELVYRKF